MEEYASLQCMKIIRNVSLQLLVARKPFVTQHQKVDDDNEGDDDLLQGEDHNAKIEMDFLGGEGGDPRNRR